MRYESTKDGIYIIFDEKDQKICEEISMLCTLGVKLNGAVFVPFQELDIGSLIRYSSDLTLKNAVAFSCAPLSAMSLVFGSVMNYRIGHKIKLFKMKASSYEFQSSGDSYAVHCYYKDKYQEKMFFEKVQKSFTNGACIVSTGADVPEAENIKNYVIQTEGGVAVEDLKKENRKLEKEKARLKERAECISLENENYVKYIKKLEMECLRLQNKLEKSIPIHIIAYMTLCSVFIGGSAALLFLRYMLFIYTIEPYYIFSVMITAVTLFATAWTAIKDWKVFLSER